jgi:hypothetical protein
MVKSESFPDGSRGYVYSPPTEVEQILTVLGAARTVMGYQDPDREHLDALWRAADQVCHDGRSLQLQIDRSSGWLVEALRAGVEQLPSTVKLDLVLGSVLDMQQYVQPE